MVKRPCYFFPRLRERNFVEGDWNPLSWTLRPFHRNQALISIDRPTYHEQAATGPKCRRPPSPKLGIFNLVLLFTILFKNGPVVKVLLPTNTAHIFPDLDTIKDYIESFRYGCPPHAGGGIGLVKIIRQEQIFNSSEKVLKAWLLPLGQPDNLVVPQNVSCTERALLTLIGEFLAAGLVQNLMAGLHQIETAV